MALLVYNIFFPWNEVNINATDNEGTSTMLHGTFQGMTLNYFLHMFIYERLLLI